MALGTQPPRFQEAARERPEDAERWNQHDRLAQVKSDLDVSIARLQLSYPGLTMPAGIELAVIWIEKAGDLVVDEMSRLEDGEP